MARSSANISPNLGLYLGRPGLSVPRGGLEDGLNFRIKQGKLSNTNIGWSRWDTYVLNGPVMKIDRFILRSGTQRLIYVSQKDIYLYNDIPKTVSYLSPRYETGTVTVTNGSAIVTGAGTNWDPELKAGDQIAIGATGIVDPNYATDGGWYTILTRDSDTQLTLTANYTGANHAGFAYTARKTFTGAFKDRWSTDVFYNAPGPADLWIATNGVDRIVKWDGVATQVTLLSTIGFRCKVVKAYRNMMLYGNLIKDTGEKYPQNVINSDVGKPEDVVNGLAAELRILDGEAEILVLKPLADAMVAYTNRDAILAQFVGDPLGFIFRTAISGQGPLALEAVADFGDHHQFLSWDTGYTFDGVTIKDWNGHVWREVLRTQDPARLYSIFHVFDETNGDLLWAFPLSSDVGAGVSPPTSGPQTAFVEHYLEEVGRNPVPFSKRSFPFTSAGDFRRGSTVTWDQLTQSWQSYNFTWDDQFFLAESPLLLVGAFDGKIYTIATSQLADGVALSSFVRFGRRPTGDGKMRGLVSRVYPFATKVIDGAFNVTVRLADHASGPYTISHTLAFDLDLPEGAHFVTPYRRGRFFAVEFGSASGAWELEGYDTDIRTGGMR